MSRVAKEYLNMKNGKLYKVLYEAEDKTRDGEIMVVYQDSAGTTYCRDAADFDAKFDEVTEFEPRLPFEGGL